MNTRNWILSVAPFVLYMCPLVTVCTLTFQQRYIVLGIAGIFIPPLLWLIGALLPPTWGRRIRPAKQHDYVNLRIWGPGGRLIGEVACAALSAAATARSAETT